MLYRRFSGTSWFRKSSTGACKEIANDTSVSVISRSMPGTTPAVETVTFRFEIPYPKSSIMIEIAGRTASILRSGSPIPINTTLVTARSLPGIRPARRRSAIRTWPTISPATRFELKPCFPVEQNVQSSTHPTWDDTHKVPRLPSGMNTVSMALPDRASSSHLIVPSFDTFSLMTGGSAISACSTK